MTGKIAEPAKQLHYNTQQFESTAEQIVDLSICIVSYNTREHLRECIRSILDSIADLKIEIIVSDNGSLDGTIEMVRSEFPRVRLIANDQNLFFTKANNQAIRASVGKYVLILNSDIVVLKSTLEQMVAFMQSHPSVGAATCSLLDTEGHSVASSWAFHQMKDLVGMLHPWVLLRSPQNRQSADATISAEQQVQVVVDAFMIVRSETLLSAGLYDEKYLLYFTEDDLCRRIQQAGWDIFCVGTVRAIHKGSQSVRKTPKLRLRLIALQDLLYYVAKYHPMNHLIILWILAGLDLGYVCTAQLSRPIRNFLSRARRAARARDWAHQ